MKIYLPIFILNLLGTFLIEAQAPLVLSLEDYNLDMNGIAELGYDLIGKRKNRNPGERLTFVRAGTCSTAATQQWTVDANKHFGHGYEVQQKKPSSQRERK